MSDAYKCDKCGEFTESATELAYSDGSHVGVANRQKHLCNDCITEFQNWLGVNEKY